MNREFRIDGCWERGKEYLRKGIYARVAFSELAVGYMIYMIYMVMGWA